jgi:hypothetical protein
VEPDDETANALLSLALQHTFCRQFDQALYYLNLWPEASKYPRATRKKVTAAFGESIKQEYPDFGERLLSLSEMASAPPSRSAERIGWWLKDLSADETFLAARLTAAERKQIIDQVENTSFDAPDSWDTELRVRRISLGRADALRTTRPAQTSRHERRIRRPNVVRPGWPNCQLFGSDSLPGGNSCTRPR